MKVVRPSENPITQGYSNNHRAYDRAGLNLPDEVRAGMDGVIVEQVDQYNTNWINTGTLTIKDYGNYIKIRHDDGSFELHAHLKQGSSLNIGTRVKAAQVVARIGNTGNSTGFHVHSEYRTAQNINMEVEFTDIIISPPTMTDLEKKKLVQFDRVCIELNKAGLAPTPASEYWFENEADPDKFTNMIKRLIAGQNVDVEKIKKEARALGIADLKKAIEKLLV